MTPPAPAAGARPAVVAAAAFFTLIDLFAAQAILPELAAAYDVSAAAMGAAVNASTLGMAAAGLAVALFGRRIDRRRGIAGSLVLLAVPTALLGFAPDVMSFAALRVAQGLCMATAFGLTLAHLGERADGDASSSAGSFAAYVTGNVASNLAGRLIAALVVGGMGIAAGFGVFAALNLIGAAFVYATIARGPRMAMAPAFSPFATVARHLGNARLLALFGVGFALLFAFVGVFSYVAFVLARPPLSLGMMASGLTYLAFAPSIVTTPLGGPLVRRLGVRGALWVGLAAALAGLPLLLASSLAAVLAGMVLVACGTFLAQAVATGAVGEAARTERGAAAGLYLAFYFAGGLIGGVVLGMAFERGGWPACLAGVGLALVAAAVLAAAGRDARTG